MIETNKREVILSIETAVQGGSLSIIANGYEIDGWRGVLEISKAEDFLEQIGNLLRVNNIDVSQIKLIVISQVMGNSTGQKIGVALAKGLRKSLKCGLAEISVMEALLLEINEDSHGQFMTAAASGKNYICWQLFDKKNDKTFKKILGPRVSTKEEFYQLVKENHYRNIIFCSDSASSARNFSHLSSILSNEEKREFVISKHRLAYLIGLKAYNNASDNI